MSDCDAPPQQDNRHCRHSRSRSPVSPGCAGETPAEREERRRFLSGRRLSSPGRPSATPNRWPPNQSRSGRPTTPPRPLPRPPRLWMRAPDAPPDQPHGAATASQASHAAASGTVPARRTGPARAQGASLSQLSGAAAATAESREGAKYRAHTQPSHTEVTPPSRTHPQPPSPKGGHGPFVYRCRNARQWTAGCHSCNIRGSKPDTTGPGDTEVTERAAEETTIVRGELRSAGSQSRGPNATVQRGQAADYWGRYQGWAKARAVAGGGRHKGREWARAAEEGGGSTGRAKGQAAAVEDRRTGKAGAHVDVAYMSHVMHHLRVVI